MTPSTIAMMIIFAAISIVFAIITVVLFYHIGKYSSIGDASKRVFTIYFVIGALIIFSTFVILIINHMAS